jgi:uncharacterized membrane protein YkoI
MQQRTALLVALGLTAFVLVVISSLITSFNRGSMLANSPATATNAPVGAVDAFDPTTQALIAARDAAYQQALAEANQQIEQANAQVVQANAQLAAQPTASQPISKEQAIQVAITYRGGGTVAEVQREQERGAQVYEVKFSDGAKVYVDATSAQVAYAELITDDQNDEEGEDD